MKSGFTLVLGACLLVWNASGIRGQDPERLQFEAASVRLHTAASPSTGRSGIEETPGLIRIENLPLKAVISAAYGVQNFQIAGPGWLSDVSVDITAKPPAAYSHPQLQPLLRNLLMDRFKMSVRHETKEVPGFDLVIAKGGSKLREATQPRGFFTARPGLIEGARVSTARLAGALARLAGRPVVDKTDLAGEYEMKVEWTPDQTAVASGSNEQTAASEPGLSLFAALNQQLGLRLQAQAVPVDVVVVEHMEKAPTEN